MRVKIAVIAGLLLIGSNAAQADVTITLSPSALTAPFAPYGIGTPIPIQMTITDSVSDSIQAYSVAPTNAADAVSPVATPGLDNFVLSNGNLIANVPEVIPDAFEVQLNAGSLTDSYVFNVGVWMSSDNLNLPPSGQAILPINSTPEPGFLTLIVSGLLSSGLVLRRKK